MKRHAGTCQQGTAVEHEAPDVTRYLNVEACPEHSPAALRLGRRVNDPAPGRYAIAPRTMAETFRSGR